MATAHKEWNQNTKADNGIQTTAMNAYGKDGDQLNLQDL